MARARPRRHGKRAAGPAARTRTGKRVAAARRAAATRQPAAAASRHATTNAGPTEVAAKRIYEPATAADGTRVLIMRYWPRGIRKQRVDVWLRELAPAVPLLRAYLDGKITWAQYTPRYLAGLQRPEAQAALAELHALARRGPVTVLCGCPDPAICHRTLLRRHLLEPSG